MADVSPRAPTEPALRAEVLTEQEEGHMGKPVRPIRGKPKPGATVGVATGRALDELVCAALAYADEESRPVSAIGMEVVTEGYEWPSHSHRRAQLVLAVRGLITCNVAMGLWLVPPQYALWIPGNLDHSVRCMGVLEGYVLFVDPAIVSRLPTECCTLAVSPLLRELVVSASHLPRLYDQNGPAGRLIQTMLDELIAASVERLHLPLPTDPRLRKIAAALGADPSDRITIGEWARRVAMSERTLCRLILQQTGMSFGRWRQQFHIMLALERLTAGEAVHTVAVDLGYNSASAFITMFKKALGQPPAKYLAARRGQLSPMDGQPRRGIPTNGTSATRGLGF